MENTQQDVGRSGPSRRKTLIIPTPFQVTFLAFQCLGLMIPILLVVIAQYVSFHFGDGRLTIAVYGITVAAILVFLLIGIYVSNRMAGPIYRLKQHMDSVQKGEPIPSLQLRDGDYFSDLVESYKQLLDRIKS